ncbi:MAG: DUF3108 domain-containing protein [Bacteroidia bacterium]|nr:DUF3108 domain-containing protein [Bacteroidia bacterium]MDW8159227.1 DUF3108 domain-containing protein [Bacteroidia bacterium]
MNSSLLIDFQDPIHPLSPRSLRKPFQLGETIVYRVHYGWFTAGEARFQVASQVRYYQGRPCFLLHGEGKSASSFEWFYKLHDTFDSFVDTLAFLPHHYIRHSRQGSWRFSDTVYYDYQRSVIQGVKGRFKMLPNTHDMLSAIYYARCLNLRSAKKGQIFPIPIFLDDGIYEVGVKVLGREIISTKLGKVRCLKVAPILIAGRVFKGREEMLVWLTDDANLLPVKIESAVIIGSISADLKEYRNLKYPITAIVRD